MAPSMKTTVSLYELDPPSHVHPLHPVPVPRPPPQQSASYLDATRPRGPSLGSAQVPIIPPQPNYVPSPLGTSPPNQGPILGASPPNHGPMLSTSAPNGQLHPLQAAYPPQPLGASPPTNGQLHPLHAEYPPQAPPYPATNVDQDGYVRRSSAPRRPSHSSMHSHHSHKSHHSRHSHDSRRDRRSSEREREREHERRSSDRGDDRRRSRDARRSRDDTDRDLKPAKRVNSHRPSWGDTIYGIFGVIKDSLGPRDKYR